MILYGLALGRVTPAKSKETIFLDNNYHLRVYSPGGRLLVSSNEYFGHDPRLIEVGLKDVVEGTFMDHPDAPQPIHFKGKLQLIQHNAQKFLLVPKNYRTGSFLAKLVIVKNSSLVILSITREGFAKGLRDEKATRLPGRLSGSGYHHPGAKAGPCGPRSRPRGAFRHKKNQHNLHLHVG